ncbi:hypothetical protein Tco_0327829 [Tanacetum coccineum]
MSALASTTGNHDAVDVAIAGRPDDSKEEFKYHIEVYCLAGIAVSFSNLRLDLLTVAISLCELCDLIAGARFSGVILPSTIPGRAPEELFVPARILIEAAAVNLIAGEKLSDVYLKIAARFTIMKRDNEKEPTTYPNAMVAKLLIG